jgi:hypothetical protein
MGLRRPYRRPSYWLHSREQRSHHFHPRRRSSVPTFTVALVENTGDFASSWWWYVGIDATQVSTFLTQHNGRLISIDPYQTPAGLRFAVVMVPNPGVHNKAWWWYYGIDAAKVSSFLSQNNARLVALRPYLDGSKRLFAVVMISNTGADARRWEWCFGETIDLINTSCYSLGCGSCSGI